MDPEQKPSTAFQNLLKMIGYSNTTPTTPASEDDAAADVDEPPEPKSMPEQQTKTYNKTVMPRNLRRESLLTQNLKASSNLTDIPCEPVHEPSRALSTCSSQSMPSVAELTSDCDLTSPARSVSPSPPSPATVLPQSIHLKMPLPGRITIAPVTKDDKPAVVEMGEAAVEKSLGRKRCIMFACADSKVDTPLKAPPSSSSPPSNPSNETQEKPQPRKCRLTFTCPTRQDASKKASLVEEEPRSRIARRPSPAPRLMSRVQSQKDPLPTTSAKEFSKSEHLELVAEPVKEDVKANQLTATKPTKRSIPPVFSEFGNSQDETDAWVDSPSPARPKLTLNDVMKKENAIRQLGKEVEEEAEAEEQEQEELENLIDEDEQDQADDFAPSDEESDGGNESDDEGGFADSDEESDDGSEYQFWAPSTTTAATSTDNVTHFSSRQRSRGSSIDSNDSPSKRYMPHKGSKPIQMRPATPELPDSTDFVCGTFDEDRPLEAAYISCRDQRRKAKQVPIPQDIDPSFPTSDPEADEDEDNFTYESSVPVRNNLHIGLENDSRGRRRPSAIKISPTHVPMPRSDAVPAPVAPRTSARVKSPAPPTTRHRSPPPRKLFGRSPARRRSPGPYVRLRSPHGSPATAARLPIGITINRLGQRPATDRTASLPHTPNPFFWDWKRGAPSPFPTSSQAITPGADTDVSRHEPHIRGPVDIVIGLEKKRQKRKEKFWRQHCRKTAKEQADRRPIPGRGVERMKELGLECAERNRGYGLGQPAQIVISL